MNEILLLTQRSLNHKKFKTEHNTKTKYKLHNLANLKQKNKFPDIYTASYYVI